MSEEKNSELEKSKIEEKNSELETVKLTLQVSELKRKAWIKTIEDYIGLAVRLSVGLVLVISSGLSLLGISFSWINISNPKLCFISGVCLLCGDQVTTLVERLNNVFKSPS